MTENEQPYKIPNDWHWAIVGDVAALHRGVSFTKDDVHKIKQADDVLIIRGGNVKEGYIDLETDNVYVSKNLVSESQIIRKNDIIVVASTASVNVIGRAGIADRDYSDVACGGFLMLVRPSKNVIPSYVDYFFQSDFYRKRIRNLAAGTNINNIRNKHILDTPIPLPSLDEQQRISGKIESLFAKLNRARAFAQNVVDGYELRRGKILHEAFKGELTAKWRIKNNLDLDSWNDYSLGELTDIASSKRIYKDEYSETGIPFFRSTEIVELYDNGITKTKYYITEERYNQIKSQYGVPNKGDLLVTCVGTIGKTWIVDDRKFYYKDGNITQVKQCKRLDMYYLQYFMMSEKFKEQVNNTVAGNVYNALTIVKFKKLIIPLPVIEEQKEIVRHLDSLLTKEQQTKELAEQTLQKIDLMKKTILAWAFRGKL